MEAKEAVLKIPYTHQHIPDILDHYEQFGFAILSGINGNIIDYFHRKIFEISGLTIKKIQESGTGARTLLTPEMRKQLARVPIQDDIRNTLFAEFRPLLLELIGPVVHASRDFHVQIKGGRESDYILQGYFEDNKEVEAPYGFHQDFPAGRVTTTPSMVIVWIPLNTCDFAALQLYPKSHKEGLFCNRWIRPGSAGLERLGTVIDILPEVGNVLIFNAMLLHASQIGPRKRVSCDLRFFPFCGVLDSAPSMIADEPLRYIQKRMDQVHGDTLKAPLWETMAYLGHPLPEKEAPKHSVLHWPRYLDRLIHSDQEGADHSLRMLVNEELGFEKQQTFLEKYSRTHLEPKPYAALLPKLAAESRKQCENLLLRNGLRV